MTSGGENRRVAVLIDGENFPADLAGRLFADVESLGNSIIRRVYGSSSAMASWRDQARQHGIALHEGMPGKNAADMQLAIEAMDMLHRGRVEAFCIVSSDSDFAALARRLRADALVVYGFGEEKAPDSFQRECDEFTVLTRSAVVAGGLGASDQLSKPKPDTRVARAALELQRMPASGQTGEVTGIERKQFEQALLEVCNGRRHVPLSELGNHLPKTMRGTGKGSLKTRLKACGFILAGSGGGVQVEVPRAAA